MIVRPGYAHDKRESVPQRGLSSTSDHEHLALEAAGPATGANETGDRVPKAEGERPHEALNALALRLRGLEA